MPTIKTIKPAGGGDYTTLAAWWSARKTSGSADEWAECYAGNVGSLAMSGMTATPSAALYPRVYAAPGNGHDGVAPTSGAYVNAGFIGTLTNYARIERIAVNNASGTCGVFNASDVLFDGFLMTFSAAGAANAFAIVHSSASGSGIVVRNCIVRATASSDRAYTVTPSSGFTVTVEFQNCTALGDGRGFYFYTQSTSTINVTLGNCVGVGGSTADFAASGAGTANVTANNCVSEDATADDFGGTGNLINQDPNDLFENPASGDFRPKPNSALIHAGANLIADFTQDIVGHERPSVGPWDIGGFQYVPPYVEYDISYTYDAVGNRLTKVDVHEGTTTYTYDAANQLTSEVSPLGTTNYTYDLNGNRTQKDDPVHGITNYTYDETNRMLTADPAGGELVSLTYNGADQVVMKQNSAGTRKYVYDGKKLLLETKADDSTELTYDFALTEEYGELTSRYHDATAGTDYYQYDGLGSTDTMSDEAEADVDVYRYKAFGQIVQQFGTEENQFTFVGRQGYAYYPELELYFAGMSGSGQSAKAGQDSKSGSLLDPVAARWTRPDPSRDNEKNPYIYAYNSPVIITDPNGNQPPSIGTADRNSQNYPLRSFATSPCNCPPKQPAVRIEDMVSLFVPQRQMPRIRPTAEAHSNQFLNDIYWGLNKEAERPVAFLLFRDTAEFGGTTTLLVRVGRYSYPAKYATHDIINKCYLAIVQGLFEGDNARRTRTTIVEIRGGVFIYARADDGNSFGIAIYPEKRELSVWANIVAPKQDAANACQNEPAPKTPVVESNIAGAARVLIAPAIRTLLIAIGVTAAAIATVAFLIAALEALIQGLTLLAAGATELELLEAEEEELEKALEEADIKLEGIMRESAQQVKGKGISEGYSWKKTQELIDQIAKRLEEVRARIKTLKQ